MTGTDSPQSVTKPQPVSLRKNFAWTFVGNLINAGSQWALVVILAKRTSTETVGQFAYALALTTPIILFASLKLRSAQATDQRHEYCFGDYWCLRLLTTLGAMVVICAVALINRAGVELFSVILIVGLSKSVESLSDIIHGMFQQHERMELISRSVIWRGLLTLLVASAILSATTSIIAIAVCLLISGISVLLVYDVPNARRILHERGESFKFLSQLPKARLWQLTLLTLPLGASIAISSLQGNIPRYVIEHYLGISQLGIFSALAYFMLLGGMIFNALAQSVIPRLARYYAEENYAGFRNILYKLIGVGCSIGLLGVLVAFFCGEFFLKLFYTVEYAKHVHILVLLMITTLVDISFLSIASAVNAMRLFRVQVVIASVSILCMTPVCFYLVNSVGLKGAALSMIFAKTFEALLYIYIYIRYLGKISTRGAL